MLSGSMLPQEKFISRLFQSDTKFCKCLFQKFHVSRIHIEERTTQRTDFPAHQVHGCFDRNRVDLTEESIAERQTDAVKGSMPEK